MPCFKISRKWLPFSRKKVTKNPSQNQSQGGAVLSGYPDYITLALMNDVIIQRLFHYLSSEDVKSGRLVCRKWEFNGEPTFKARFRLYFDSSLYHTVDSGKKALTALKTSFQNSQTTIPFIAIRMSGRLPWVQGKLTKFFELEGKFITDLTLQDVRLPLEWSTNYYQIFVDFGSVIRDVWKLKRLEITNRDHNYFGTTRFKLTLEDLRNIQVISLTNCAVQVTPHILKPVSLKLSNISFYDENEWEKNVLINEFVNFSDLRNDLLLSSDTIVVLASKLTLDLQGNFNMEKLMIWGEVEIINSEASTWTVDTVYFFRHSLRFQEMRKMKVIIEGGDCTLSYLPPSLTKLSVKDIKFHMENENELWNLHLANNVAIPAYFRNQPELLQVVQPFMPHFDTIFNNLKELHLMNNGKYLNLRMEMQQLPQRLKKLFLTREGFKLSGDAVQNLDILSLKYVSLEFAAEMLNHFAPDNIVIYVKDLEFLEPNLIQNFLDNVSQKSVRRIILGIFVGIEEPPPRSYYLVPTANTSLPSPFPAVVKPEEFYAFVDGKGRAIKCDSCMEAKKRMESEQDY